MGGSHKVQLFNYRSVDSLRQEAGWRPEGERFIELGGRKLGGRCSEERLCADYRGSERRFEATQQANTVQDEASRILGTSRSFLSWREGRPPPSFLDFMTPKQPPMDESVGRRRRWLTYGGMGGVDTHERQRGRE